MNLHDENGNLVNFCVPLEGSDEEKRAVAIEVIDKAVEMGSDLFEGVYDHHNKTKATFISSDWDYIGVDSFGRTLFVDAPDERVEYGNSVQFLSIVQFRNYYNKWKNGDDLKDQTFSDFINPEENKQSLDYEKFQQLFSILSSIYNDNTSTWEQKHNKVFGDTLASDICNVGNMKIPPVVSTNHIELSAFYEAVKAKLNYLKYYY